MYRKILVYIGAVLAVGVVGYSVYELSTQPRDTRPADDKSAPSSRAVPDAPALTPARTPPQGYKEYRSEFYRFQVFYPQDMAVATRTHEGSAATIAFAGGQGRTFSMLVQPYGKTDVAEALQQSELTQEQVQELREASIDGAPALAFFSTDPTLGETREVWFIQKGFLYQVVTRKADDAWLQQLLSTWLFLERGRPLP